MGALQEEGAPVWIKPNNRPYGRGENKQTGLAPVGNAPLFPLRGTSPGGGSFSGAMLSAAYEMIALRRFYSAPLNRGKSGEAG